MAGCLVRRPCWRSGGWYECRVASVVCRILELV
jgi:hypothetical protein